MHVLNKSGGPGSLPLAGVYPRDAAPGARRDRPLVSREIAARRQSQGLKIKPPTVPIARPCAMSPIVRPPVAGEGAHVRAPQSWLQQVCSSDHDRSPTTDHRVVARLRTAADLIRDQVLAWASNRPRPIKLSRDELLTQRINQMIAQIADSQRLLLNKNGATTRLAGRTGRTTWSVWARWNRCFATMTRSTDILVNGPQHGLRRAPRQARTDQGAFFATTLTFLHVAQRIASTVGRRVDESSPMLERAPARRQPGQCDHSAR